MGHPVQPLVPGDPRLQTQNIRTESFSIGTPTRAQGQGTTGTKTTTLTQPAKAGDTKLHVVNPSGWQIGDLIQVGNESAIIKGFGSIDFLEPLNSDHPHGETVTRITGQENVGTAAGSTTYGPRTNEDILELYKVLTLDKHGLSSIRTFEGNAGNFSYWRDQMRGHIARGRPWLGKLLDWARNMKSPITVETERNLVEASFDVATVSEVLHDFIVIKLGENMMYLKQRVISSAGAENRGLELWRLLLNEFDCQTHSVILALINQWSQPDQTRSLSTLQKYLDSWIELGMNIESAGPEYRQPDLT